MTWVATGTAIGGAVLGGAQQSELKKEQKRRQAIEDTRLGADQERQRRMEGSIGVVNSIFDSSKRQAELDDYMNALRGYFGEGLDKQHAVASRQRKFAVARGGQTGGSQDYATQRDLGDEYAEATLGNEQRVREAGAGLRADNESSRNQIINLIRQGMGATDAVRRSQGVTGSNAANAFAAQRQQNLGDLFQGTTSLYRNMNESAERRRGFGFNAGRTDLYGR